MADAAPAGPMSGSVARGLAFLASRQLPGGQFPIEATLHYQPGAPVTPDSSPFATTHIVHSLGHLPAAAAAPLIGPALTSMRAEMSPFGLWRYWNREAVWGGRKIHSFIPADLDDTATHSVLLRQHGIPFPDNTHVLLQNRDRRGLFYTWFVVRSGLRWSSRYWLAALSEMTLARLSVFWRTTEASYNDVDAVVNANVLLYLGERAETQPVIAWLRSIIASGTEATCDKWYRDMFTFHYAVSRCRYAGIRGLDDSVGMVRARLAAAASASGQVGDSALQTALAACTLMNFGLRDALVTHAVDHLAATQRADGSWPAAPYYFGGPKQSVSWGSAELTTALCIEAIHRAGSGVEEGG